jgi:hypothetical protein
LTDKNTLEIQAAEDALLEKPLGAVLDRFNLDNVTILGIFIDRGQPALGQGDPGCFVTGKKNYFIPLKMHVMQVKALTNARSVTSRIYTSEDQA